MKYKQSNNSVQHELILDVVTTFEKDYEQLMKRWSSIEEKAKNNIMLSGVFLGGIFGLLKDSLLKLPLLQLMYSITIILIILCIIFAWLTINLRKTAMPYLGSNTWINIENLYKANVFDEECKLGYFAEKAILWDKIIKERSKDTDYKAVYLKVSNAFLFMAIISFGLFVIFYKI